MEEAMKIIKGGVTAAKGFQAAGLNAGIKNNIKKDMAMIFSEKPCVTAGTFTQNKVFAAPVKWDKNVVYHSAYAQAVIVNSGVANACTGKEGDDACTKIAEVTADKLNIPAEAVLIASTGVIGKQLPMDKICQGIDALPAQLDSSLEAGTLAAEAIMTTDTRDKQVAVEIVLGGKTVTVGGMCKGAGMIHPNMATMLCFVTTDVCIAKPVLQEMMSAIIDDSFNMISVDGDTSTNDTALVLANGFAENPEITGKGADYDTFYEALSYVLTELSKMIAGDGEGCTCLFEAQVVNAETKEQAKVLAKAIVTSSLTKAAIFGHDANWGRILCAMGYSGADLDPEKVDIYFESKAGKLKIVENGSATDYSEDKATEILSQNPVTATADVKMGSEKATAWGCDLTFDYVKINADYRS
jgi:glutamate N-acetyltransferase/amino-acid N-acetyltransferase